MNNRAWHFLPADGLTSSHDGERRRLRVHVGKTMRVAPPIELCKRGLHWSHRAIDALYHAPGPIVQRVEFGGEVQEGKDKGCSSERTCIALADATDVLWGMSRWTALQVVHLWDAPTAVRQFLETGEESLRDAARAAAQAAAWDAVSAAAQAAAWDATRDAARAAAWAAAWDAASAAAQDAARAVARAVARDAARDAAWDAARDAQNTELERRLRELLHLGEDE